MDEIPEMIQLPDRTVPRLRRVILFLDLRANLYYGLIEQTAEAADSY